MTITCWMRVLSLVGYFGLFILLMLWNIWLAPSEVLPKSLVIFIAVGPLLFPLRGILHGRPYTHAWTSFLALFYLTHGIGEAYSSEDNRYLGALEILFSSCLFIGTMLYARYRGRELKAEQEQAN